MSRSTAGDVVAGSLFAHALFRPVRTFRLLAGLAGLAGTTLASAMTWFGVASATHPHVWGGGLKPALLIAVVTVTFAVTAFSDTMPTLARLRDGIGDAAFSLVGMVALAGLAASAVAAAMAAGAGQPWPAAGWGVAFSAAATMFGTVLAARSR